MKKLFILSFFVFNTHATLGELIDRIYSPTLRTVIRNSGNITFGSRGQAGVHQKISKQACIEKFNKGKNSQIKEGEFLRYGSLTHELYGHALEGEYSQDYETDDFFGRAAKRGLGNNVTIRFNSYNASFAPHADSDCSEHINIEAVEIVNLEDKKCRRVLFSLDDLSYHSFFCSGDENVYVDYLDTEVEIVKEISEKTEDCK